MKPLEKKTVNELIPRILFLLVLLATGIIANYFVSKWKNNQPTVLGEKRKLLEERTKEIAEEPKRITDGILSTVKVLAYNAVADTKQTITDTASKSADVVSQYIFDNTIGTIIKQIEKLPDKEKQEVKEAICK